MIRIEKDVPIPQPAGGPRQSKYPYQQMVAGDSFVVPAARWHSIRTLAKVWGRKVNGKFTTRREGDNIRVWRVS